MDEKKYYTVLYEGVYPDSGVVVYKPIRLIRGYYDVEKETFKDEETDEEYSCVNMTIPNFGSDAEHPVDALTHEIVPYGIEGEKFFAFPIAEDELLEFCDNEEFVGRDPKEVYEREVRSYMLYSVYDEEADDNIYYIADKLEEHNVYNVDVSLNIVEATSEAEQVNPVGSLVVVLQASGELAEEDVEEPMIKPNKKEKLTAKNSAFTPIVEDFDPDELEKNVTSEVIGQEHVAKPLVSMLYKNKRYNKHDGLKSNMLILGPSGCGKTELARSIERNTGIPVAFFDASSASASGYVGNSVTQAIRDLISVCNGDVEKAEHGIIVIDEIDKLTGGDGVSKGDVQDELFKMLEGDEITIPADNYRERAFRFNPKNVTFIGVGAAQNLIEQKKREKTKMHMGFSVGQITQPDDNEEVIIEPEDLIKYGFKPELLRRFPIIKVVKNLDRDKLISILTDSKISNLKLYEMAFEDVDHVKLVYDRTILEDIAEKATKEKAGASGLKRVVDDMLQTAVRKIRLLNGQPGELVLTRETIDDPDCFELYRLNGDDRELVYPPKEKVKKLGTKK